MVYTNGQVNRYRCVRLRTCLRVYLFTYIPPPDLRQEVLVEERVGIVIGLPAPFETCQLVVHIFGPGVDDALLADPELRSESTGAMASRVSIHPAVRKALVQRQRDFANQPSGAVLDGRDIGTVIAPDADVKLYVTASAETRAGRRMRELQARRLPADLDALVADIRARDERDMNRPVAPLKRADGAALLDTSDLSIEAAVQQAIALVDALVEGQRAN